jgi:hypothetical protein
MLPQANETRPRRRIGRYLITGRIGRGGMGMVYRGLDEALEREVAVKTLTAEGAFEEDSRKRFEVEAKAAARLQHPNIVIVYELGEDRGVPFIAMEMLPGVDLEALLRAGEPLPLTEKLDVVIQVCRGLAYAHEHGIVHRDIKPSNIRLLEDGTAKIMDFGIAKLGATHLTKTGMMVGTVHYMSPEQVRGKPLDGRSDVFSVGVILYELLAGQRPFRGEGATEVLYKIVHEPPPPVDLSALGGIAPRLQAVLERALAKDRDARYPGAAALAEDLAALLEEQQRAVGEAPAPGLVDAVAAARRTVREGHLEEGVTRLRELVATHPNLLEAHRALRAALREQKKRLEAPAPPADEFPELEATFSVPPTRRAADTLVQGTETIESGSPDAAAAVASAERPARRDWMWVAGAIIVVAGAAAAYLLSAARGGGRPVEARVPVRSQPMGATVLANGRETGVVTNGELVLPSPVPDRVVLTFRRSGHRDETRTVRLPLAPGEAVSVALLANGSVLPVKTEPAGASVTLDGERVAGVTPLEIAVDPSREHRINIALEGYAAQEVRVPAGGATPIEAKLERVLPPGTVAISSPYPLDVLWRGKALAKGVVSPRVQVAGGRQVLTLVSGSLFLRTDVTLNVSSGGEVAIEAPGIGRLSIRANPDNCEIFIDGTFVDYPPILDRPVAAGTHSVSFRWPGGEKREQTVQVSGGVAAFVTGRKESP